ncbi:hypothetical protein N5D52_12120 [Pseudomonas sp. GD03860]|uniref:sigma factor n=1 Tax=Pseudomonas TaxID=286 RepID=UPI002363F0D5|nr:MULTISPECIES: sigma factor [Pseudomonas]MDD2060734.1 hypothetical protein [Pseudomonas putida]MDH0637690.1 hypothetical protein [Pseudomonas sp. GD03860]
MKASHPAPADMAQETFIRLLGAGACVAPREPRAFLSSIARRLLIDRGRRQRLGQAYRQELARHVEIAERLRVWTKTVQTCLMQALLQCHAAADDCL